MIGIRKLSSLPEGTRLRKYPRLLRALEEGLRSGMLPASGELRYFGDLLALIGDDARVSEELQREARAFAILLKNAEEVEKTEEAFGQLLFTCNNLRHRLLRQTGAAPADWDLFSPPTTSNGQRRVLPIKLFLDGIRSPFNTGTIFRSAESFGVEEILIAPGGADPSHPRAQRSSMGCIASIPWSFLERESCIELSRRQNLPLIAVETGGPELNTFSFPPSGVLILGSEELGVSPLMLNAVRDSGGLVSITTGGLKGSINVAVAAGIVLHRWFSSSAGPSFL